MTEFNTLTEEEIAQLEAMVQGPAFRALSKVARGYADLKGRDACDMLLVRDEKTAAELVQRAIGANDLLETLLSRFTPEPKEAAQEQKPKSFHDLMP